MISYMIGGVLGEGIGQKGVCGVQGDGWQPSLAALIAALRAGLGMTPRDAERAAYRLIGGAPEQARALVEELGVALHTLRRCDVCGDVTGDARCAICADQAREAGQIRVVEDPRDVAALERRGGYRGRYHILYGAIMPLEGVGPDRLRIGALLQRARTLGANGTVVLATRDDIPGRSTAMYLWKVLQPLGVHITRDATGLPPLR